MGTYTTVYNLYKPAVQERGWGALVNTNFDLIDAAIAAAALSGGGTLDPTGVTPGEYTRVTLTVDTYGRITDISTGSYPALDDLSDVVAPSPVTGDVLTFNGTNWVPDTPASGLGSAWAPLVATVDDVPDLVFALVDGAYQVVMVEEYR